MKKRFRRQAVTACAAVVMIGSITAGGMLLVPWMQSVPLGTGIQEPTPEESGQPVIHITHSPADLLGYNWTQGAGAMAEPSVPQHSDIITVESAYSLTLHEEKPYPAARDSDDGVIEETHYGLQKGNQFFALDTAGQVRNCTHHTNTELLEESRIAPHLPLKADGTPMVLIYHTHTTESYEASERSYFDKDFNYRTTQPDKNMVMVGDAIANELAAAGIGVIHAETIHDYPAWNGSYGRSAETVSAILEQYPSVCIALDIHRDAISTETKIMAPVAEINGKKAAQIMMISGCDDGTMGMPNYLENFHLASSIQQTMEAAYPGLTRPILFDYRKYNQDLTTGSLLIEVGTQGNTMEEARYAGSLFGKSLAETILTLIREENQS
ncbi:MAG: stage II sporulation protein P [Ruminococcus sp.]|nr:stage II sporulation protein P [Ruminococcus sp.]